MSQIERRDVPFESEDELVVESRADGRTVVQGYAVVWNRLSVDLGGFRERILPGAFDKVLNRQRGRRDLVSYYNHDHNFLLGRESAGTLEVFQDDKGLGYRVYPPATRADVIESIARRDVKGSSFTFSINGHGGESFTTDESGRAIREVRDATIYELGPVVQPAYESTTSQVARRSYELWLAEQEEVAKPAKRSLWLPAAARLRAALLRSFT